MKLKPGQHLVSMAILPAAISGIIGSVTDGENEPEAVSEPESSEQDEAAAQLPGPWLLFVTSNGMGKRMPVSSFRKQARVGMGTIGVKLAAGDSLVAAQYVQDQSDEVIIASSRGLIQRLEVGNVRCIAGRNSKGVKVMKRDEGDSVQSVAVVPASPTV